MTAVIFGSTMGNAEEAANKIAANLGIDTVLNIAETSASEINGFDKLIIGSSTWGSGDLQDDMDASDFSELYLVLAIALAMMIHIVMLWEFCLINVASLVLIS